MNCKDDAIRLTDISTTMYKSGKHATSVLYQAVLQGEEAILKKARDSAISYIDQPVSSSLCLHITNEYSFLEEFQGLHVKTWVLQYRREFKGM